MCSYFGPGNFSIWSVAILLQVSPDSFAHHHPHAPPLCGLGGGAFGTPHLYWLTPTYPGLWVVDWCHFQWGTVSLSNCTIIGPAGSNTVCTDWTVFAQSSLEQMVHGTESGPHLKPNVDQCGGRHHKKDIKVK